MPGGRPRGEGWVVVVGGAFEGHGPWPHSSCSRSSPHLLKLSHLSPHLSPLACRPGKHHYAFIKKAESHVPVIVRHIHYRPHDPLQRLEKAPSGLPFSASTILTRSATPRHRGGSLAVFLGGDHPACTGHREDDRHQPRFEARKR